MEKEGVEVTKYLGDVIIATNQNHEVTVEGIKASYQEIKDDSRNKSMEEKQALQIYLEEVLEGLWLQMQQSIENYKKVTEEKRRIYVELMAKDKKGLTEVVDNNKKILKLTDDSTKLKETLGDINDLEERRLSGLRKEKEELVAKLHEKRKLVSIRHTRNEEQQVKKISYLVDILQTKISSIEKFQEKAMIVMKGCNVPVELALKSSGQSQDRIVTYINESSLQLMKAKEERKALLRELHNNKLTLRNHLKNVAKEFK